MIQFLPSVKKRNKTIFNVWKKIAAIAALISSPVIYMEEANIFNITPMFSYVFFLDLF